MPEYQKPTTTRTVQPRTLQQQKPRQMPPRTNSGRKPPRRPDVFPIWTVPVIVTCIALIALMGWWVQNEYGVYQQYLSVREKVNQDTFYPNTFVDNIDLSGKSMAEAEALLGTQIQQQTDAFALVIAHGEARWRITSQEVPVANDSTRTLRRAYAVGRSGSLSQRYSDVRSIEQHGLRLDTELGYDHAKVRELTDLVASRIDQPVVDAKLTAFNPNTREFVFAAEQSGLAVDRDRLYADVTAALDAKQYDIVVSVQASAVQPTIRQADIGTLYGRISVFSTTTTKDKNRNNNISLSAQAINGKMLLPGESMSFNECTGQRTPEKGYQEAGAISGGQLVDETGGGVCQTSSTLFNAIALADLEIVTRTQHSWPSTYVPRGQDATVDWPRLDFVFKNNQDAPVFIIAWFENQQVTVEVYGKLMSPGRSIELLSETLRTYTPSSDTIYTRDLSLVPGTSKVAKEKRTGYQVDTYRVYFQDGAEVSRVKMWRTEYRAVQKEMLFN